MHALVTLTVQVSSFDWHAGMLLLQLSFAFDSIGFQRVDQLDSHTT